MATVRTDGLGIYAKPLRFGSPTGAEKLTFAPVTLKPAKPLRPGTISNHGSYPTRNKNPTSICRCCVILDAN
jgi:hypothetical protein